MAETATPPTGGATGWRGLEPASLLINLLPDLWRTVRSGWPLLLAIVVGGGARSAVDLGFLALFLGLSLGRTIIHFLTLRFRLNNGKLEIQSGLLGRRNRVIEPAHIQNTELVQNPFHRVFGLVELRIETAGEQGKFVFEGGSLDLPCPSTARAMLGQRPEHIHLSPDAPWRGEIMLVEPTGADTYVVVKTAAGRLTVRVAPNTSYRVGEQTGLTVSGKHNNWFDVQSTKRMSV